MAIILRCEPPLTAQEKARLRAFVADSIERDGWCYPDYSDDDTGDLADDNGHEGWGF